jgi:hypothetical protein
MVVEDCGELLMSLSGVGGIKGCADSSLLSEDGIVKVDEKRKQLARLFGG